jgi:glucose-6-phosphate isomerase
LLDLRIQQFNADTLGQLILFFESLTVAVGITLGVDPFNQPGVEAGKKYAHDWLGQHAH